MDVRYNIIQWVHRYTRGWSYGAAVVDPRTGEIIKGNVTLGSLRGRQDYLIAEALSRPYTKANRSDPPTTQPPMVLAAHPPARRARNRPYPRSRPQFRRQRFPHPPDEPSPSWIIRIRGSRLTPTASPISRHAYASQHRHLGQSRHRLRLPRVRRMRQSDRRSYGAKQNPRRLRKNRPHLHHR